MLQIQEGLEDRIPPLESSLCSVDGEPVAMIPLKNLKLLLLDSLLYTEGNNHSPHLLMQKLVNQFIR